MPPTATIPLHRRLRVRHLELLATLHTHASLHQAAAELGMTQPAASKLLLETEAAVGGRLFERSRRGVMPTPAGTALSLRARRLLGLLDGARDELAAIEAGATGLVRVGVAAVALSMLVPQAIAWLRERAIRARVRVEEAGSEVLLEGLRAGRLDCVIARVLDTDDTTGFVVQHLYQLPVRTVARPGHPLLRRRARSVDWASAQKFEWVLPPPDAPLRRMLTSWLAQHDLPEPACALESVSILANVMVVSQSDAIAMLPQDTAHHYEKWGVVKTLDLPFDAHLPAVSMLRRRGESADGPLGEFMRAVQDRIPH
jgi:DNA-binding transcriptional LysR family regulator